MRKLLVFLLIFLSCYESEIAIEPPVRTTITTFPFPDNEVVSNTTTTTKPFRNSAREATERREEERENFDKAWQEYMKEDIVLSDYEKEVNKKFRELWSWKGSKWEAEKENFYEIHITSPCFTLSSNMSKTLPKTSTKTLLIRTSSNDFLKTN